MVFGTYGVFLSAFAIHTPERGHDYTGGRDPPLAQCERGGGGDVETLNTVLQQAPQGVSTRRAEWCATLFNVSARVFLSPHWQGGGSGHLGMVRPLPERCMRGTLIGNPVVKE